MKKILALVLALTTAAALCACGGGSAQQATEKANEAATKAAEENTVAVDLGGGEVAESATLSEITYIQDTDMASLSPWDIRSMTAGICYEIYEMLYGVTDDGTFYPILADANKGDWMPGCDHVEGSGDYTIYIYDYITDSQGNKITASDVKFCFDQSRDAGFESGWGSFTSEEVVDDTTIILHCEEELNKLGELQNILCRCFILSQKAYEASSSEMAMDACGTGPYVLESFTPNNSVVVTRRADYWQTNADLLNPIQCANIEKITLQVITESTQQVIGLETGTIDIAEKQGQDNLDQLEADGYGDKFDVYTTQANMMVSLYCNCDPSTPCGNVALRKAILMAVDNEVLAAFAGNGMTACKALGNSFYGDYDPSWEGKYSLYQTPDAAQIQALLDEAGYNGEELTLLTANFSAQYAETIQAMLSDYGINVVLNIAEGGSSNALKADPNEWDIFYGYMAADDYLVNYWSHLLDADGRSNGKSESFLDDQTFQDMLHNCMTSEGHTKENMEELLQYVDDNAIAKAMVTGAESVVYPAGSVKTLFFTDKRYLVPGACTYAE